ncbi:MAG: hypothetical protein AVDCRST_MAG22-3573, partial [uncultured Rubrobacteraceae bacterium]
DGGVVAVRGFYRCFFGGGRAVALHHLSPRAHHGILRSAPGGAQRPGRRGPRKFRL